MPHCLTKFLIRGSKITWSKSHVFFLLLLQRLLCLFITHVTELNELELERRDRHRLYFFLIMCKYLVV